MFIYGLKVELYTDHQPLTALFNRTNVSGRILRWAPEVQQYNVQVIYLKGAANKVADALSRGSVYCELNKEHRSLAQANDTTVANISEEPSWTKELRSDPVYSKIIDALENGRTDMKVVLPGYRRLKVADFAIHAGYLSLLDKEREPGKWFLQQAGRKYSSTPTPLC